MSSDATAFPGTPNKTCARSRIRENSERLLSTHKLSYSFVTGPECWHVQMCMTYAGGPVDSCLRR